MPVETQQVTVSDQGVSVDTSADNNASSMVIKGKDLDALSDDPDELQSELSALAGPSAGPNGGQIYIDGFTGGQLPPKSSIREIRINQNPFSAQYDKLGYGRIEILTKPGTDKFHGSFMMNGNDSAFNSLNPFVTSEPSYYSTFMMGNAGGALNKTGSWFASVFRRDNQSNSIVNAELLDSSGNPYNYTAAVANPQSRLDVSPRFDFQLGPKNTLTVRYMFDRQKETNSGVSLFALAKPGLQRVQSGEHAATQRHAGLSDHVVNETRFQYTRDRDNQTAQSSDPTITVQGAFTGGGNNMGVNRDNQDRFELQNSTIVSKGAHSINFGARLRFTRDASYSTSGFNGQYIYSSLDAYKAQHAHRVRRHRGNRLRPHVNYFDAGLFFQDDFKVRPNLTLSYGLRYESQNDIGDHADWAPRLSFAWAPGGTWNKPGQDRDPRRLWLVLRSLRRKQYPSGHPQQRHHSAAVRHQEPHLLPECSVAVAAGLEQHGRANHLHDRAQPQGRRQHAGGHGRRTPVRQGRHARRHLHQLARRAPGSTPTTSTPFCPALTMPATGTGTRPNGINENIYQFQSGGVYNQNQLMLNYTVRAKRVSLFGFYMLNFANADTSGASYFPSNQSNPGADYGRANFDVRNRFLLGGNLQAPFGVSFSPMMVTNSGRLSTSPSART